MEQTQVHPQYKQMPMAPDVICVLRRNGKPLRFGRHNPKDHSLTIDYSYNNHVMFKGVGYWSISNEAKELCESLGIKTLIIIDSTNCVQLRANFFDLVWNGDPKPRKDVTGDYGLTWYLDDSYWTLMP